MDKEIIITRESACSTIQALLNYCGGDFTFKKPVLIETDYEDRKYEACKSLALGEDCFAGFTEYNEPIYEDRIKIPSLLYLISKLRTDMSIMNLSQAYSDLSLFFCWSLSDRNRESEIKTAPAGTDENYTIALDEFHKSCVEIEARFPGFASEDSDDILWYDEFIDDILPMYMNFIDHKDFQPKEE